MKMRLDAESLDDVLVAESLHHGSLGLEDSSDFEDLHLRPGQVLLGPPTGGHTGLSDNTVMTLCLLNHTQVAQHAAARCGIDPETLRFNRALSPINPGLGRAWTSTVAHVRDDILADPEIAAEPLVHDSAFRLLATTLLATFANTALDAIGGCGPVGDVDQTGRHEVGVVEGREEVEEFGAAARKWTLTVTSEALPILSSGHRPRTP